MPREWTKKAGTKGPAPRAVQRRGFLWSTLAMLLASLVLWSATPGWAQKKLNGVENPEFLEELIGPVYKAAKAPPAAALIRWDFSRPKTLVYSYEQEARDESDVESTLGVASHDNQDSLLYKAQLRIIGQGHGTAKILLEEIQVEGLLDIGPGNDPWEFERGLPNFPAHQVKEDGTGIDGVSTSEMLLNILLTLPGKPLKVGESARVPMELPFLTLGGTLSVNGHSRYLLKKYVKIDGRLCAEMLVNTSVSDLKVPPDRDGTYSLAVKGASILYFNVAKRCVVSGASAVLISREEEEAIPQLSFAGRNLLPEGEHRSDVHAVSRQILRIHLEPDPTPPGREKPTAETVEEPVL